MAPRQSGAGISWVIQMVGKDVDVNAVLRDVSESGGIVIRGFRGNSEFAAVVQEGIDQGKLVAFFPTAKTCRWFFNAQGFIMAMNEVFELLHDCRVVVGPNAYGYRLLWVVGPSVYAATNEVSEGER